MLSVIISIHLKCFLANFSKVCFVFQFGQGTGDPWLAWSAVCIYWELKAGSWKLLINFSGISSMISNFVGLPRGFRVCRNYRILKISGTSLSLHLLCKSDHFNYRSREICKFPKSEKSLLFEKSEISRLRQLKWSLLHNKKTMNQVCDIFLNQNSVELEEILEEFWERYGIWNLRSEISRSWELAYIFRVPDFRNSENFEDLIHWFFIMQKWSF